MSDKLTIEEFAKIEDLAEAALCAPNQPSAKKYIQQLNFAISSVWGSKRNMLTEMANAVANASGRVSDKEWKVRNARDLLIKAQMYCVEKE